MKTARRESPWRMLRTGGVLVVMAALLLAAAPSGAVHCPPLPGEGAKKVRDIDGDNVKDHRYQGTGAHQRTFTDEHGSRIEFWCLAVGEFVWVYIPGTGKPLAGKHVFVGHCKYFGGGNDVEVKKEEIDGKEKFKELKWNNKDVGDHDPAEKSRQYCFDAVTGKIKQVLTKQDGTEVVERDGANPPTEDGNGVGLPMSPGDGGDSAPAKWSWRASQTAGEESQEDSVLCLTGAVTSAHTSTDTPQAVPDLGVAESRITVNDTGVVTVRQVTVDLVIDHQRIGDLVVTLEHGGQQATLINRVGQEGGAGLGCEGTGFEVSLDDCAAETIHLACELSFPVVQGRYRPDDYPFAPGPSPLGVFDGADPLGDWVLFVSDQAPGAEGTLQGWELHLAGDGDVGPLSVQPPEARLRQEVDLPRLIGEVESLGLLATPDSNRFWWEVGDDVGPVEVESVVPGSAAAEAGLQAADMVVEMLNLPHNMIPGALRDFPVEGGMAQLGYHIQRNRQFGLSTIDLRVLRGPNQLIVSLEIGRQGGPVPTTSTVGFVVLILLLVVGGAVGLRRRYAGMRPA